MIIYFDTPICPYCPPSPDLRMFCLTDPSFIWECSGCHRLAMVLESSEDEDTVEYARFQWYAKETRKRLEEIRGAEL